MPPYERYPGPPARGEHVYRVVSPWRDALAWVAIAGPLAIARYLLRDGDGWREAGLPVASALVADLPSSANLVWALESRDPVELHFVAVTPGLAGHAAVTVDRHASELVLELRNGGKEPIALADLIALADADAEPILPPILRPGQSGSWTLRLPASP